MTHLCVDSIIGMNSIYSVIEEKQYVFLFITIFNVNISFIGNQKYKTRST